jgi:methionine sulfoxide reductase heme-binding subunit
VAGSPSQHVFWFASRALGIVAMLLLGISVAAGLIMAGRLARRPGLPAKLKDFHEASTLVTLALIAGHGGLLLFDSYLRPGLAGISLPFALSYRPLFTGIGIIAGWLAALLGLSFYARKRIGVSTWRFMHRFTVVVYLLAVAHVLGAGTNGRSWWMLTMLTALTAPVVFGFTYRILPGTRRPRRTLHAAGARSSRRVAPSPRYPLDGSSATRSMRLRQRSTASLDPRHGEYFTAWFGWVGSDVGRTQGEHT